MTRVGLVTDSTADLPLSYYKEHEVLMVPLTVRFGEDCYKDWLELNPDQFYQRLRKVDVLPKTSQPSSGDFVSAYENLKKSCDSIISLHISSKLSGTVQAAEVAKSMVDIKIEVVDTKLASLGVGMVLDELVKARDQGKTKDELVRLTYQLSKQAKILFTVDTLKYLELGGRIGKAEKLVGSLLQIKPLLTLQDGMVVPYKKVRGRRKVLEEMIDFVLNEAKKRKEPLSLGLAHADNPEALAELKNLLTSTKLQFKNTVETEIGSVIGTYTGPGTFALVILSASAETTGTGGYHAKGRSALG